MIIGIELDKNMFYCLRVALVDFSGLEKLLLGTDFWDGLTCFVSICKLSLFILLVSTVKQIKKAINTFEIQFKRTASS